VASRAVLIDHLAPILAIASALAEHEGELGAEKRRAIAEGILELTQKALLEMDVTSEELALALQRYNEREKPFWKAKW
jgi:hypothetical protein